MNRKPDKRKNPTDRLRALKQAVDKYGLLRDPSIDEVMAVLEANPADDALAQFVWGEVEAAKERIWQGALFGYQPSKRNGIHRGDIPVAFAEETDVVVRLPLARNGQHAPVVHSLICGASGGGKSTLGMVYARGAVKAGLAPVLMIDRAQAFRKLLETERDEFTVLRTNDLRLCPFHPSYEMPEGVDWKQELLRWVVIVSEIFREVYERHDSITVFQEAVLYCLQRNRAFDKTPGEAWFPTFHDLHAVLKKNALGYPKHSKQYQFSVSLHHLIHSAILQTDPLYDCSRSDMPDGLLNRNVILELDDLPIRECTFLVRWLLAYIDRHLALNAAYGSGLRNMVVFDEAQLALSRDNETLAARVPELRQRGLHMVFIVQNPSVLSPYVLQNCSLFACVGPLPHEHDQRVFANAAGLNRNERQALGRIQRGTGILRLTNGSYRHPFAVNYVNIPPGEYSEEERRPSVEEFIRTHDLKPRVYGAKKKSKSPEKSREPKAEPQPKKCTEVSEEPSASPSPPLPGTDVPVSQDALALGDVIYWGFRKRNGLEKRLSDWYTAAGLSGRAGNTAKEELVAKSLFVQHEVHLGGRGKPRGVLWPTKSWVKLRNVEPIKWPGKSRKFDHVYIQNLIASVLGEEAEVEGRVGDNKLVDVLHRTSKKTAAYEISITTRPADELENVIKDQRYCDEVIICVRNKSDCRKYRKTILADSRVDSDKVSFRRIMSILKEKEA